jgi:glycosyltransferase involved in cell wall biosynthesis
MGNGTISIKNGAVFDSIVCLAPFPWKWIWHTSHYLGWHLARRLPVLYVEPAPEFNPFAGHLYPRQIARMLGRWRLRAVSSSLHVLTPRSVPLGSLARLGRFATRLYVRDVMRACSRQNLKRPLFWTFDDRLERLHELNPAAYVYHVLDLYRHTPAEASIVRGAATLFAVSQPLCEYYRNYREDCHLLPNGVETRWFNPAARDASSDPGGIRRRHYDSVIGYTGSIGRHSDVVLILKVAEAFPASLLVIIGPILRGAHGPQGMSKTALSRLRRMANVCFVKPRAVWELPAYMRTFDVCIMPAMADKWAAHSDPLKLYQYLAMGKPVVSSKWNNSYIPDSLYYPACSSEDFIRQIRAALNESYSAELANQRFRAVESRDWAYLINGAVDVLETAGYPVSPAASNCRAVS